MWSFIVSEESRAGGRRIRKGGAGSLDEEGRVEADARVLLFSLPREGAVLVFFFFFLSYILLR